MTDAGNLDLLNNQLVNQYRKAVYLPEVCIICNDNDDNSSSKNGFAKSRSDSAESMQPK